VRFRGGKGVATSLGVLIGFSPLVALLSFVVFLIPVLVTRWVALGSVCGAVAQAALFWILPPSHFGGEPLPYRLFGLAVGLFVIMRHRTNIARIKAGTENRISFKRKPDTEVAPSSLPAPSAEANR
jgi:glycerol-3-phosphate acyltransferase PlsY